MSRFIILLALFFIPSLSFAMIPGTISPEVKTLQRLLNESGYTVTNYGAETTYFGPQTEAALARFQIDHAADILGGVGVLNNLGTLDPLTRAYLFGSGQVLGITTITSFNTNLTLGMKHPDVLRLQQFLNGGGYPVASTGPGSKGQETTYYGPATAAAVTKYQEAHRAAILTPNNLTRGTGQFLASTRAHLNSRLTTSGPTNSITRTTTIRSSNTTYTLTVNRIGRGVVTNSAGLTCSTAKCAFVLARDTRVTLTAIPDKGNLFSQWSGTCRGKKNTCTFTMTKSQSVTATFKSPSSGGGGGGGSTTPTPTPTSTVYTLTAAVSGQGSVTGTGITCGSDCTESFTSGTIVTLTAAPTSGNTFAGWSGACSGTQSTCTVSMTQARTASASFTTTPTQTITNGVCGTSNSATFSSVPTTNLCSLGTASLVSGSGPWSWSCAGVNGGTTAQCSANLAVSTPTTYALTLIQPTNGTISGTGITCGSDCSETYNSGTAVTLTATPASGYTFSGWSGACSGTSNTCSVSMTMNRSVSANFIQANTELPSTSITASLVPTRTSGPSPLAVLFDASGTTGEGITYPFHDLTYTFDYGDINAGTWTHSGLSKNSDRGGPIGAHVYDTPGTYTVRLRAENASGAYNERTVTITVTDPNAHWSGTNTICVSTSANYSSCPAGALQQTTLPASYDGKRVLLRSGESFGVVSVERGASGVQVNRFASGAKPVVSNVHINSGTMSSLFASDITIMRLDITNGIEQSDSSSRVLLYQNDLNRPGGKNSIVFGGALGYMAENNPSIPFYIPREVFVVENHVLGQVNNINTPFMNLSGEGSRIVIMGNDMSRAQEHTSRFFALHKSLISHNALRGQSYSSGGASIRSTMKIHSGGLLAYDDLYAVTMGDWATSRIVIANNLLGDVTNNGSFTAGAGPQNRELIEGVEDVILENNRFVRGSYTNTEFANVGRRFTFRGNVRTDGGVANISIDGNFPLIPLEWQGPYWYR